MTIANQNPLKLTVLKSDVYTTTNDNICYRDMTLNDGV